MDVTGSMGSWIQQAKDKVVEIVKEIKSKGSSYMTFRVGFIGYRDHCDKEKIVLFPFDSEPEKLRTFLTTVAATGGGDEPEDIAGGLSAALAFNWEAATKLIFLISDAPCHGKTYHSCSVDNYPDGDPNGLDPEQLVFELRKKEIDIAFVSINKSTDIMVKRLKTKYDANTSGRKLVVLNLGDAVSMFMPNVVETIKASIRSTMARSTVSK